MYFHSCCGTFFAGFQTNIRGCQSRIMLHPLIMNGWGLLLCRHVRATAADTSAGRHWEWVSTKPWPWCCLHGVCLQILRSHFLHFSNSALVCTLDVWMAHRSPCGRIKWNRSPCTQACKCLLSICECKSTCVCVCHVFGIVMSFHMSPCPSA